MIAIKLSFQGFYPMVTDMGFQISLINKQTIIIQAKGIMPGLYMLQKDTIIITNLNHCLDLLSLNSNKQITLQYIEVSMTKCTKYLDIGIRLFIAVVTVIEFAFSIIDFITLMGSPTNYEPYIVYPKIGECVGPQKCGSSYKQCFQIAMIAQDYIAIGDNDTSLEENCFIFVFQPIEGKRNCVRDERNVTIFSEVQNSYLLFQANNFNSKAIRIVAFVAQIISLLVAVLSMILEKLNKTCFCQNLCFYNVSSNQLRSYLFFLLVDILIAPFYAMTSFKFSERCVEKFIFYIDFTPFQFIIIGVVQIVLVPAIICCGSFRLCEGLWCLGVLCLLGLTMFNYFIIVYTTINTVSWVAVLILIKMGIEILTEILIFCSKKKEEGPNQSAERIKADL